MKPEHKRSALNRLKTARGHLDGIIAMLEAERYCPDVMKQVSAVQSSLEKVNRVLLQNHVETCVLEAVEAGRSAEIVDELLETLKYSPSATGPAPIIDQGESMKELTLSVPEVHCDHCKHSIEGAVAALNGVSGVTVDLDGRTVDVGFDEEAVTLDAVVAAIEGQGYSVAGR